MNRAKLPAMVRVEDGRRVRRVANRGEDIAHRVRIGLTHGPLDYSSLLEASAILAIFAGTSEDITMTDGAIFQRELTLTLAWTGSDGRAYSNVQQISLHE